mmetsp:Transcript_19691/g.19791  ORF Transcript_19691/g.19791 Transcript_19691/m.19791 type:complete len:275 (-) Transcript_19691:95-919(-)|eukprot:CAMPEP_0182427728 /NCGR_PEP_ID=MMETSP1167-20130531/19015_1 /TAXON_ID=2988 /ORGANISM="Mallomonas Sp, Strain CCMP3275" /LENGTH=274 /DNA_ID=CAMNT_0024610169 /DNA_START=136 /DNA_END=960 /DNA_ORIENTATION=+
MELQNIGRISSVCAYGLNVEETAGLEVAMLQRRREENLSGRLLFWGKVFGVTQDYLVVYSVDIQSDFPEKKYYYCTTSSYVLKAVPELSSEYEEMAQSITSRFTGDASYMQYNGAEPEEEPDDPDMPPVERFREVHRLSYNVKQIDHDCAIVAKGALVVDATKRVIFNAYYTGLSYQSATEARSYYHYRRPENPQAIATLKKAGIIKSGEFLDSITKDIPSEMWTISQDNSGTMAYIRNLYWEGYYFYNVVGSNEYGGAYFGLGVPNYDIAFML